QTDYALERRYKFSVAIRINIRVSNLHFRCACEVASHFRFVEVRMIVSDRHRPKKAVEIYQSAIIDRVVQVRAAAFVEIHDDLEPVQQDMLLDRLEDFGS